MSTKNNGAEEEIQNPDMDTSEPSEERGGICFDQNEFDQMMVSLDEKNTQLEETQNKLLRLQADFDNFRRRTRQEKEDASQIISGNIITKLLPVLDNFERALATGSKQDAEKLFTGMELVSRQFMQILEGLGVTCVSSVGCQFDPNQHEAVMRVEDANQPDGLIVEELQKGYMANSKLLRPCMVKVVSNC